MRPFPLDGKFLRHPELVVTSRLQLLHHLIFFISTGLKDLQQIESVLHWNHARRRHVRRHVHLHIIQQSHHFIGRCDIFLSDMGGGDTSSKQYEQCQKVDITVERHVAMNPGRKMRMLIDFDSSNKSSSHTCYYMSISTINRRSTRSLLDSVKYRSFCPSESGRC